MHFAGDPAESTVYQNISSGLSAAGIEYYLPLFYEKLSTIFDYFPEKSVVVEVGEIFDAVQEFWAEIKERYEARRHDVTRPLIPPEELFLRTEVFFKELKNYARVRIEKKQTKSTYTFPCSELPPLKINRKEKQPFELLLNFLNNTTARILFGAESPGRRESLLDCVRRSTS